MRYLIPSAMSVMFQRNTCLSRLNACLNREKSQYWNITKKTVHASIESERL